MTVFFLDANSQVCWYVFFVRNIRISNAVMCPGGLPRPFTLHSYLTRSSSLCTIHPSNVVSGTINKSPPQQQIADHFRTYWPYLNYCLNVDFGEPVYILSWGVFLWLRKCFFKMNRKKRFSGLLSRDWLVCFKVNQHRRYYEMRDCVHVFLWLCSMFGGKTWDIYCLHRYYKAA